MSAGRVRVADLLPPCVLWLLALGFLLMARGFPGSARAVPELIGWAMLGLCSLDIVSRLPAALGRMLTRWLNPAALEAGSLGGRQHSHNPARQAVAVGGLVLFVAGLVLIGVLPAVPLFVLLAARFGAGGGWRRGAVASVCVTGLIYLLFVVLLHLELYPGVLLGADS